MNKTLAFLLAIALAVPAFAAPAKRYLVATKRPVRQAPLQLLRDGDEVIVHKVHRFESVAAFAADLTDDEAAELRQSAEVRSVSEVVERHALEVAPGAKLAADASRYDAAQTVPYGIDLVRAREVWPVTRGGGGLVNIAVLDTGFDRKHPDLFANYAGGYNTLTKTNDPTDDNYHGTHVAGTIGARDNNFGVVGVAPEAHIWSLKVLDRNGSGTDESVIAAVDWVIAKKKEVGGQWVMSLSLGSSTRSLVEEAAFERASDAGILTFAASGNDGSNTLGFPAGYSTVASVGAVDSKRARASFSTTGPTLTFVAPGVSVLSTIPDGALDVTQLTVGTRDVSAYPLIGSGHDEVVGPFVDCGFGATTQFPASVRGNIALIKRGNSMTFAEKTKNATAAGARAVIIYNDDDATKNDIDRLTLLRSVCDPSCHALPEDAAYPWPMVIAITQAEGERLRALPFGTTIDAAHTFEQYGFLDGTSMSTPHASGVAALIWAVAPTASAAEVLQAMKETATDLGAKGYDSQYGNGLVNALEAAKKLNPAAFSSGGTPVPPQVPPAPVPTRRRGVGH
jgi:subtilisin family serine protease